MMPSVSNISDYRSVLADETEYRAVYGEGRIDSPADIPAYPLQHSIATVADKF